MTSRRVLLVLLAVAAATLVACLVAPSHWQRATGAAALLLAAGGALETVAALWLRPEPAARGASSVDDPPLQLRAIGRAVEAAERSPRELARQLRPYLRGWAAVRLGRRGVALDGTGSAHELLGDDLFDLLVRDVGTRAVNREGGLRRERLRAMLDRLEEL